MNGYVRCKEGSRRGGERTEESPIRVRGLVGRGKLLGEVGEGTMFFSGALCPFHW